MEAARKQCPGLIQCKDRILVMLTASHLAVKKAGATAPTRFQRH